VFIKLWLDIKHSTINRYFAFVVNDTDVFQLPQLHKHFNVSRHIKNMSYTIKSVDITKLLITSFLLLIVPMGGSVYLSTYEILSKNDPLVFLLFLSGFVGAFINIYLINHGNLVCRITKDNLHVGKNCIPWSKLKSYKINNGSHEFETLKIKTFSGKTTNISHRKKFAKKDDFSNFLLAFENQVFTLRHKGFIISKAPQLWDTLTGKIYGYVLIALMIAFTVVIFTKDIKPINFINYLIFIGFSIPLLLKIFRRDKYGG
jgi:hypothetical protein